MSEYEEALQKIFDILEKGMETEPADWFPVLRNVVERKERG